MTCEVLALTHQNKYSILLRKQNSIEFQFCCHSWGCAPKSHQYASNLPQCQGWPLSPNKKVAIVFFLVEIQDAPVQISGHHCAGINSYLLQQCQSFWRAQNVSCHFRLCPALSFWRLSTVSGLSILVSIFGFSIFGFSASFGFEASQRDLQYLFNWVDRV